jgi:hypothetical protein
MSQRAKEISQRIKSFGDNVIVGFDRYPSTISFSALISFRNFVGG